MRPVPAVLLLCHRTPATTAGNAHADLQTAHPARTHGLLIVGTMTSVLGDHGHGPSAKRAERANRMGISSLARVEILASGFKTISGIAVEASGAVLVTDRAKGTLTRIDASGNRHRLLARLHKTRGVAVDGTGDLLILDEGGSRLVRLGADGSLSVVTSSLRRARAIAVGPDGRVWVASRRMNRQGDPGDRSRKTRASEYGIVRVEPSGALATLASGFMDVAGIAADASHVYVAMGHLATERRRQQTTLALVPVDAEGKAGAVEPLLRHRSLRAHGVAVDAVGDLFVSGAANKRSAKSGGSILKRRRSGELSTLAVALNDPVAVVFAPNGDLVQAFWAPDLTSPVAAVTVLESGGGFTLHMPLALNTETRVSFLATAGGGAGLVSTPHTLLVVHDDRRPTVAITEPPAGVHVRDLVTLRARGDTVTMPMAVVAFASANSNTHYTTINFALDPGPWYVAAERKATTQIFVHPPFRTLSVGGHPNPTNVRENRFSDSRLEEYLTVNDIAVSPGALYRQRWIDDADVFTTPPPGGPIVLEPILKAKFEAMPVGPLPVVLMEAEVERVYEPAELDFLKTFVTSVPPP